MTRLIGRAAALAAAAFVVVGPLVSLGVWSVAERWTAPSPWPQRVGLKYWSRMLTADFLDPLRLGLVIALIVTALALVLAIPLGYALARLVFPGRALVLLASISSARSSSPCGR
jgi:putative spermidine/putrescine transport system permease protein